MAPSHLSSGSKSLHPPSILEHDADKEECDAISGSDTIRLGLKALSEALEADDANAERGDEP